MTYNKHGRTSANVQRTFFTLENETHLKVLTAMSINGVDTYRWASIAGCYAQSQKLVYGKDVARAIKFARYYYPSDKLSLVKHDVHDLQDDLQFPVWLKHELGKI